MNLLAPVSLRAHEDERRNVRVDHLYTTLQTILSIKVTLSSTSSKNLSLDDELVGTCLNFLVSIDRIERM